MTKGASFEITGPDEKIDALAEKLGILDGSGAVWFCPVKQSENSVPTTCSKCGRECFRSRKRRLRKVIDICVLCLYAAIE